MDSDKIFIWIKTSVWKDKITFEYAVNMKDQYIDDKC